MCYKFKETKIERKNEKYTHKKNEGEICWV